MDSVQEIARTLPKNNSPVWLSELRDKNLARVKQVGFPTVKDEDWKYTNISSVVNRRYELAMNAAETIDRKALKNFILDNTITVVVVNGMMSQELSDVKALPQGVSLTTFQDALKSSSELKELFLKYKPDQENVFIALNDALTRDGLFLKVNRKTISEKLIHIIHVVSSLKTETMTLPRTMIALEESSEASILESYVSLNDETHYFTNALTDIFLAQNSKVEYFQVQKQSLQSSHIGNTRVWQERDSRYHGFSFIAGGAVTRNNLDVVLNGEGAECILNALYSVYGTQHVDNHTSVDHRVPNCTSNQLYKGILNGSSRAVFNGKIFVQSIAQKTNSYQLNKNLLLGKDCRVDTKPQLEIFADDVKCTHGATIGQLNEDEVFYLRTRAIAKQDAVRMLARGFAEDVLNQIPNNAVHQKLTEFLEPSFAQL